MPVTMAPTKTKASVPKATAETIPGPGQKPPRPHPMPKRPAPASSRLSTVVLAAAENAVAKRLSSLEDEPVCGHMGADRADHDEGQGGSHPPSGLKSG